MALQPVQGRLLRWLVGAMVAAAIVGCQLVPGDRSPSPPPGAVSITLLSDDGPLTTGPPYLMAGRTIPELKALLHGLRDVRFHDPDGWDAFAGLQRQVFIALAGGYCKRITSVTATKDSSRAVLIDWKSEVNCSQGAGSAAIPRLFLASISRAELGPGVVTFRLNANSRARVDLRQPVFDLEPANVAREAMQAVVAVRRDGVQRDNAPVLELDVMRWPDNTLACGSMPTSPEALPVVGYIVVVQSVEFHWSDGRMVDCAGSPTG